MFCLVLSLVLFCFTVFILFYSVMFCLWCSTGIDRHLITISVLFCAGSFFFVCVFLFFVLICFFFNLIVFVCVLFIIMHFAKFICFQINSGVTTLFPMSAHMERSIWHTQQWVGQHNWWPLNHMSESIMFRKVLQYWVQGGQLSRKINLQS